MPKRIPWTSLQLVRATPGSVDSISAEPSQENQEPEQTYRFHGHCEKSQPGSTRGLSRIRLHFDQGPAIRARTIRPLVLRIQDEHSRIARDVEVGGFDLRIDC